jgi:hypothetical protein
MSDEGLENSSVTFCKVFIVFVVTVVPIRAKDELESDSISRELEDRELVEKESNVWEKLNATASFSDREESLEEWPEGLNAFMLRELSLRGGGGG